MASFTPNPTDPNNVEVKKGFVFNETGNIMMATTDMDSAEIEKSVRDVFAEVSVFFGAMTKAMDQKDKSLFDYEALDAIISNSGCFVKVTSETVKYNTSSTGVLFSTEFIESLLGIATGTARLPFANAMLGAIGQQASVGFSSSNSSSSSQIGNIIFICEYLLGMPVISAVVAYTDVSTAKSTWHAGPCASGTQMNSKFDFNKDTYMFVTPQFIKQYSGDLIAGMDDPQFEELTKKMTGYLDKGSSTTTNTTSSSGNN